MPSPLSVVDLTGSDDELSVSSAHRPSPGIGETSAPNKSSQAKRAKPSPSKAAFPSSLRNVRAHPSSGDYSANGPASKKSRISNGFTRLTPLDFLSREDWGPTNSSARPRTPTRVSDISRGQDPKPIVLSDDESPERPVFRRPRGYDGNGSERSKEGLVTKSDSESETTSSQMPENQKRHLDENDIRNAKASCKRAKLDGSKEVDPAGLSKSILHAKHSGSMDRYDHTNLKRRTTGTGATDLTASPPRSTATEGNVSSSTKDRERERSLGRINGTLGPGTGGATNQARRTSSDRGFLPVKPKRSQSGERPLDPADLETHLRATPSTSRRQDILKQRTIDAPAPPHANVPHHTVNIKTEEGDDETLTRRQRKQTAKAKQNGIDSTLLNPTNIPTRSQLLDITYLNGSENSNSRDSRSHSLTGTLPQPGQNSSHKRTEANEDSLMVKEKCELNGIATKSTIQNRSPTKSSNQETSPRKSGLRERSSGMPSLRRSSSPSSATAADLQLRTEAMVSERGYDQIAGDTMSDTFSTPNLAASAVKSSLWAQMPLPNRIEKVLGKYLEEMREDNEYWSATLMQQARMTIETSPSPDSPSKGVSFASMRPIRFTTWQRKGYMADNEHLWKVERIGPNGKSLGVTSMTAQCKTFQTEARDVPNYAHYVGIQNNFLAPNVKLLHCWPYFGDDFDELNDADNLREQYQMDIANREEKLLLLQQAQKYEPYVHSVLRDLDCTWADVLRYLIEEQPKREAYGGKSHSRDDKQRQTLHNFSPSSSRSIAMLGTLPASSAGKMDRIEILSERFQKMAKFGLWHVARRSTDAKRTGKVADDVDSTDGVEGDPTCRLCLRFNCPYHGELKERGGDDSDGDSSVDKLVATDIVEPPLLDHREHVNLPTPSVPQATVDFRAKTAKRDAAYWRGSHLYTPPDERVPFHPCHHPGSSCEAAQCACFEENRPCEKSCGCAPHCNRRFQGCSCARRGQRCFNDLDCACFNASRECDPDLCGQCGICEVVDPVNRHNEDILRGRCQNCYIQRGVPKQTLLGDSGIHGLGLYACEDVHEHDFVGEYKGEIITKEEAERRGAVYELQKLSYLFSLNATQEIDSTYFGNKVRFINHASRQKANLYPRIMMVNTVHRIALYASRNIKAGQELLFDYGPKFPDEQLGGKKQKKSAPHVRNANLVKSFVDVEESEDEVGNVRAKAVNRSAIGRGRPPKAKKRRNGQTRAGAERDTAQSRGERSTMTSFQQAGERLAAFNISEDALDDLMELDNDAEDEEYRDDEESEYDSEESEERQGSDEMDSEEE